MKNMSVKKIALCAISLTSALFMLVALAFPLVKTNGGFYGYDYYLFPHAENGFQLLDFKSLYMEGDYAFGSIIIGITSYLQLLSAVSLMALSVVSFFIPSNKMYKICGIISIGVGVFFALTYMIFGIVYSAIINALFYEKLFYTLSYIPFIITSAFLAGYIVCGKLLSDKSLLNNENGQNKTISAGGKEIDCGADREADKIELLKKYKDLLDCGVITNEEFEDKKSKLLGR